MTEIKKKNTRAIYLIVSAIFLLVGIALFAIISNYWSSTLEPRLNKEANAQAELISHAQANAFNEICELQDVGQIRNSILGVLDSTMLLRHPTADQAFFESIALQMDYGVINAKPGSLDLQAGKPECPECFTTEVPLFCPQSGELIGIAKFLVNDKPNKLLKSDIKKTLFIQFATGAVLLLVAWVILMVLIRKLHHSRIEAERATQAKSQFLASMSHEIRSPLNAVLGFSYLFQQTHMTVEQENYLGKIQNSARHLLGVINDILDFSKVEAGKFSLEVIPFNLTTVLETVKSFAAVQASEKGLEFSVTKDRNVPDALIGDPLRLEQVLDNLIGNAVKFTDKGRIDVSISVGQIEGARVELAFIVSDTGIGMSDTELQNLFVSFQQADSSITRRFGGSGLGLAISKHLVEMMGGNITAESQKNHGSSFRFSVVMERDEKEVVQVADITPDQEVFKHARILIVDDHPYNLEILSGLLANVGAEVTIARNGHEALEQVAGNDLDAVLMDIQMPDMDGYEATRRIRKTHPNLPVIATTAHALPEQREESLMAGMNAHIPKPIDANQLWTVLAQWINREEITPLRPVENRNILPYELPGIDIKSGVARVGNDPVLFRKYLLEFPKWAREGAVNLITALENMEWETAQKLAHTLKGTAAAASAVMIREVAADIDEALRKGERTNFKWHIKELEVALEKTLTSIASIEK